MVSTIALIVFFLLYALVNLFGVYIAATVMGIVALVVAIALAIEHFSSGFRRV